MNEFRTAYLRYGLAAVIVLASLIAWQPANSVSGTYPDRATVPVPADKHSAPSGLDAGADPLSEPIAAMLAAGGSLSTCGAPGNLPWGTTSASFQVIRQCTLSIPQAGRVFLSANSSVSRQDGDYWAQFEIDIDATDGDSSVDRWVNISNDSGGGTDENIALSVLKPIRAGTHTFYFLGERSRGTGTVLLNDPTLTVIVIPEIRIYLPLVRK